MDEHEHEVEVGHEDGDEVGHEDGDGVGPWARIIAIGRAQGGPVAVWQAIATGIPRSTWDDRVRREGWQRPFRGVAVLPGREIDAKVEAWAAALAVGPDATVTGRSALHLAGVLDQPSVRPHIVVGVDRRSRRLAGVRVTRSRTLCDEHRSRHGGLWIASAPRAFLDVAATTSQDRLRTWLIDARQRGVTEISAVAAVAGTARSTPGRGRLLLACADVDASGADSALVAEVETRLKADGFHLDVPPRSVPVSARTLHPDITLYGLPVGVEVDGFGVHRSRRALDLDQRKHNAYALAGWTVLRISWTRLGQDWAGFVAELRLAIDRGRG